MNECLFLQGVCLRANPPKSGAGHKESDGGSSELCQGGGAALIRCAVCVSRPLLSTETLQQQFPL